MTKNYIHGRQRLIDYFDQGQHHPRSNGLDKVIGHAIVEDLGRHRRIQPAVEEGLLCFRLFATVGASDRNVDLVVGPPPPGMDLATARRVTEAGFIEATPVSIYLGAEFKSIMTEHGKNWRNRRKNLEGHAQDMHNLSSTAISVGLCLVNAADSYYSPTADAVRTQDGAERTRRSLAELYTARLRGSPAERGLDILCTPVVVVGNEPSSSPSRFLDSDPAPGPGSKHSWDAMIETAATQLSQRFSF